jgi:hypothetical protein
MSDKHKAARDLALQHFSVEDGMMRIFRLSEPDEARSNTIH